MTALSTKLENDTTAQKSRKTNVIVDNVDLSKSLKDIHKVNDRLNDFDLDGIHKGNNAAAH